jgi:phytoene/squalene synthetase
MMAHNIHLQLPKGITKTISNQNDSYAQTLPARITKAASKQTYYTIRFLVDRERILNAYRTYAYFRWVDDWLDQNDSEQAERITFLERQHTIIDSCYRGEYPFDLTPEEDMIVSLIQSDNEPNSGLKIYIYHMMKVMDFDSCRKGKLISEEELIQYTRSLSIAVTEAMHYFIGHNQPTSHGESRYLSVIAAHIAHMLRDTCEDIDAGYINIPQEFLSTHGIGPEAIESESYREWVKERIQLARFFFKTGEEYLGHIKNLRCRIAGYAYMARFVGILDTIEKEGYQLRSTYPERKSLQAWLRILRFVLAGALRRSTMDQFTVSCESDISHFLGDVSIS